MIQGTVKRIFRDKGFGFIEATDGREVFFHRSELIGLEMEALSEGDSLTFEVVKGKKGPQATQIKKSKVFIHSYSFHSNKNSKKKFNGIPPLKK